MEELERRLAALEKKVTRSQGLDTQMLAQIMHSAIFKVACLVIRDKFGLTPSYEFSEQEKMEIAKILLRDGSYSFTPNDVVNIIIEMDKKARKEEEGNQ